MDRLLHLVEAGRDTSFGGQLLPGGVASLATYDHPVGYDLHLTRAEDWLASDEVPLSLDEWVSFARSSTVLTETSEISTSNGVPVFLLGSDARTDPALYWDQGQVTVRGAHDAHVPALVAEASNLRVRLLGDDGEAYE